MEIRKKLAPLFTALALAGCATTAPNEDSKLINQLNELNQELKIQREEIQRLHSKLNKIETVSKTKPVAQVKPVKKKTLKLSKLIKKPKRETQVTPALERVPANLEEEATIADSSHEELHKYFKGVELLRDKKTDEGLILLKEFISENPKHVYADRAQVLIGETYLKNKEYGLVIAQTHQLERSYPHSVKMSEALYQRASAFLALNQKEDAKITLERILSEFPKDKFTELAGKRLSSLQTPLITDPQ